MFTEILAVGTPGGVHVFDLRRGTRLAGATNGGGGSSSAGAARHQGFAMTDTWVAAVNAAKPVCAVHMLNRGDTAPRLTFPLPEEITCVLALDGGRLLAAGAQSGRVLVWAPASGRLLRAWDAHYGAVTALASSGGVLATGGADAAVHVWALAQALDAASDLPPSPLATMAEHTLPITALHVGAAPLLAGRARVYSASGDHTVKQWRVSVARPEDGASGLTARAEVLATLLYPAAVRDVAVDAPETRVFAATAAGLFMTPLYAGAPLAARGGVADAVVGDGHVAFPAAEADIVAITLSLDATLLVSAAAGAAVRVWDTASRQCLRTLADKTLAAGASQLVARLAPLQLGGPRAAASAGLQRPPVLAEAVVAPKLSAISFVPLQRIAGAGAGASATAFEAPVRVRLADTTAAAAHFDRSLAPALPYSDAALGSEAALLAALRPANGSSEQRVADLLAQVERLQRHYARTRCLNDELYQGAVSEWLSTRQQRKP
ncbi:Pre-rRNA-processing protein ipi3 [Kickxella alabastrina]|uniref:Pre-rRNA-processing protein ipi3 n=1 Tax=Kickxella alabastrina TaxID=61397 RepID=A0ACC1I2H5_9FUNG|nr:Pre-rRNA-processing protein ipi3 [Kickxella alabastrina]